MKTTINLFINIHVIIRVFLKVNKYEHISKEKFNHFHKFLIEFSIIYYK